MLTAAQCETVAYYVPGDILCSRCRPHDAEPVSRFELDFYNSESYFEGHEKCACSQGVSCGECYIELSAPWSDPDCHGGEEA